MSIATELTALQQDITNARTAITTKGGTVTSGGGSSQLATDIATIPSGGNKYGATINGLLGDIDGNGNYILPTEQTNLDFSGIITIPNAYAFYYKFYNANNIGSVSFPDLTTVSEYALSYAFSNSSIISFTAPNLTTVNNYGLSYIFYNCSNLSGEIILDNLTSIHTCPFQYSFYGTNISKFSANGIQNINESSAFTNFLYNTTNTNLKVYFNGLKSIRTNTTFSFAFSSSKLVECEFNELESISGSSNFNSAFHNTNRTIYNNKVWHCMPKLKTINGNSNFTYAFGYIGTKRIIFDSLESIGATTTSTYQTFNSACQYAIMNDGNNIDKQGLFFPVLTTIGQNSSSSTRNFQNTFTNSNNRHSIHFYELTTIYNESTTSSNGQFNANNAVRVYMPKVINMGTKNQYCFTSSTLTTEIHFGIENQATIQAMTGYASKFGATNATIYFDMVNHITVDGTVYDRDGAKCDLDNWYFAWTNGDTTIYTTNFKDPAVGDTVYTKSGTTYTSAGTIGAIA